MSFKIFNHSNLKKKEIFNIGNKITWKIFGMPYYRGPPIMLTPAPINYKN